MKNKLVNEFTREECIIWLNNIGQSTNGSTEELKNKIRKFSLYPKLVERLKKQTERNYEFKCSLDPSKIPEVNGAWKTGDEYLPKVSESMFYKYCSYKSKGNMGKQEKAVRMLQSRKIVNVKTFMEISNADIFIKELSRNLMEVSIAQLLFISLMELYQLKVIVCALSELVEFAAIF